jgi:phosphoribosylglycinamide formyltransferase-1
MPEVAFNIVVLVSGSGSNLQSIIDHADSGALDARVAAVISDNPEAYGLVRAKQAGVPALVLCPDDYSSRDAFEIALVDLVTQYRPRLIVLAGFMRILGPQFVNAFNTCIVNIHPSLLPRHRGLNTHQRAIDAGDSEHGATVHFVTAELDHGPVIIQAAVSIDPADNATSLQRKVLREEHVIYPKAIQWIADGTIDFHNPKPL